MIIYRNEKLNFGYRLYKVQYRCPLMLVSALLMYICYRTWITPQLVGCDEIGRWNDCRTTRRLSLSWSRRHLRWDILPIVNKWAKQTLLLEGLIGRIDRKDWLEGLIGRIDWKDWLEGLIGRIDWKDWLEGLIGRIDRKDWPEGLIGRIDRKDWLSWLSNSTIALALLRPFSFVSINAFVFRQKFLAL